MLESLNNNKIREFFTKPFIRNINPDIITWLSLIPAVGAGVAFYYEKVLLAGILVILNGYMDTLDGQIAKTFNRRTKFGDFLDHALDRFADVAILLGITLSGLIPKDIGFYAIIAMLLVSYMGTQAQAITSSRLYAAVLGRADRIILLGVAGILSFFYIKILYYAMLALLILSIITFFQRFVQASIVIKKEK